MSKVLRVVAVVAALVVGATLTVDARQFTAQIQLALQQLGIWPYDGSYADGEVPVWSAAQGKFLAGSGGGGGSVPAADVTAGTFGAGNYIFPGTLGVTGNLNVTGAANTTMVSGSGFSVTGSGATSAITYTGTWNTSGIPTFFFVNITDTASAPQTLLFDWQVGGASMASLSKNGALVTNSSITAGSVFSYAGSGPQLEPLNVNSDAAAIVLRNAGGQTAIGSKHAHTTESLTTTKTTDGIESNELYYTGDTDGQVITLMDDPTRTGLMWHFVVTQTQASNSMSIAPSAGETLRDGAGTCSTFTSTVIGSTATITVLTAGAGGLFVVTNKLGTWVCTP